jgi:hypothetical protein
VNPYESSRIAEPPVLMQGREVFALALSLIPIVVIGIAWCDDRWLTRIQLFDNYYAPIALLALTLVATLYGGVTVMRHRSLWAVFAFLLALLEFTTLYLFKLHPLVVLLW